MAASTTAEPAPVGCATPSRWWLAVLVAGAVWAAVNLVLGAVVAPVPFSLATPDGGLTREQAGAIFGMVLERWSAVAWGLTAVVAGGLAMGAVARRCRPRAALVLGLLAVLLVGVHLASAAVVAEGNLRARERREEIRAGQAEDPASAAAFATLHQRSRQVFLAETALAALAAILAGMVLFRRRSAPLAAGPRTVPVLAATLLPALLLNGCIRNETEVVVPPEAPGQHGQTWHGTGQASTTALASGSLTTAGQLPQQVDLTVWRRSDRLEADGRITTRRQDEVVATDIPWWQWFPFDLPASLVPMDFTTTTTVRLDPRPVPLRTAEDLDREAAAAGYATRSPSPVEVR